MAFDADITSNIGQSFLLSENRLFELLFKLFLAKFVSFKEKKEEITVFFLQVLIKYNKKLIPRTHSQTFEKNYILLNNKQPFY
jgi:hypothetical protein